MVAFLLCFIILSTWPFVVEIFGLAANAAVHRVCACRIGHSRRLVERLSAITRQTHPTTEEH